MVLVKRVLSISMIALLAACGSGSGSNRAALVDSLASGLQKSSIDVKPSEAKCVAEDILNVVGVDTMQKINDADPKGQHEALKALGKNLSTKQVGQVVDALTSGKCMNFAAAIAASQKSTPPFNKMTVKQSTCVFAHFLDNPAVKAMMGQAMIGKSTDSSALSNAFSNPAAAQKIFGDCNININSLQ